MLTLLFFLFRLNTKCTQIKYCEGLMQKQTFVFTVHKMKLFYVLKDKWGHAISVMGKLLA